MKCDIQTDAVMGFAGTGHCEHPAGDKFVPDLALLFAMKIVGNALK